MEHHNPLLAGGGKKFITIGEIMLRLSPPNYDKIRVAFATGNPVAARDDLIAAIREAVERSHHSGEAVRVIRRYLAAMDAGKADRARSLDFDFMEVQ